MTTTVTKQPANVVRKASVRDPLGLIRDEWNRFMTNFEENGVGLFSGMTCPTLDLGETDKSVEIRMDLPGLNSDDIDIQLSDNTITISGERKEEKEEKGKTWQRVERQMGTFSRTVTLPCAVKNSEVNATYRDGVLHVSLPKSAEAQTKKITIKK